MSLKDFLDNNPIINMSQLSNEMWPDNKNARIKLYNKLNEKISGSGTQRITDKDLEDAKRVLNKLADEIKKL
ncbi:hypothetical protein CEY12_06085 [Chryseobacterium sp. T16E-39]|uniref:hypothetical protein n=1 Tax=Chryseobacterium sp. T16E-39 TaxID=2015076 RepID=UPI000B5B4108|nr:hypothetical protein [Chryseobacterium sp. T16E-39]ASK29697.1 hypothetical protein CEY12_06085 [Chryseobacterium sp. T16E-39]